MQAIRARAVLAHVHNCNHVCGRAELGGLESICNNYAGSAMATAVLSATIHMYHPRRIRTYITQQPPPPPLQHKTPPPLPEPGPRGPRHTSRKCSRCTRLSPLVMLAPT